MRDLGGMGGSYVALRSDRKKNPCKLANLRKRINFAKWNDTYLRKKTGNFHIEEEVASRSESKTCGTEKANRLCEVFDKREKTMYIPAGHQAAHLSHVAF